MNIANDRVVSINYTLTNAQGQALDATGAEPFSYLHGHRNIISGLEKALDGRKQGDSFKIHIPAADAYGERSEKMITTVPLDRFDGADSVQAGMQFHAETSDGELQMVTVTAVEGDLVTIDGNHPMAGLDLNFDVSIVDVREASEEELQNGCVQGAECDCEEGDCAHCHDCG
ncbi:MAG: peptidylprolyl isomerase [Treponema sp.]|jgi:FKBP-type peptidyl-prolyl cis-trans isomerase SlyD|nr:peptidylprolyl isomerase [Treponema sp.]